MPSGFSDYRAPAAEMSDDTKAGWVRELVQEGQQWLSTRRAYKAIAPARHLILDDPADDLPAEMSKVRVPRTKRQIRELVSILANLKPTASNRTDNKKFYDQATVLNQLDTFWWYTTFADRKFREGFQAAAVDGTGYISHVWDPDLRGRGKGDIRTDIYSADDVYLVQPPADHDLQNCYAVVMKRRVPLFRLHAQYPLRAHELTASHGTKGWTEKGLNYVQSFMQSPLRNLAGVVSDAETPDDIWPSIETYEIYILDLSINLTGRTITMGKPGTTWEYNVPAYGEEIRTGTNGWEGLPLYRKAGIEDARLYPLRRRMVATDTVILEDGPSPWWHGMVPLARIRFDDWWCEPLGFSLARDTIAIEEDAQGLLRGVSDAATVRLAPPMAYDENLVSERLAERLNPRQPRQMLKLNLQMGEAIKPILPANYADLPNYIPEHIRYLADQQDYVIGVRDLVSIAKAKQIPSADSIEKILEMAGPLAQDMTRGMEAAMRDLGEMRRYLNFQFRPLKRRIEILGDNGITESDLDWDPGTMVPSHLPDENPDLGESRATYVQRAREHAGQFYFFIQPNSLARLQQMSQKLILLQLAKAQLLPLSPWSIAKLFEVDNYGVSPNESAVTLFDEWVDWVRFQAGLQHEAGQGAPQKARGRPSSGNAPPRIVNKDGGTRSTIATSR